MTFSYPKLSFFPGSRHNCRQEGFYFHEHLHAPQLISIMCLFKSAKRCQLKIKSQEEAHEKTDFPNPDGGHGV